tara:strand:+ start:7229 stop:7720 length:492 start_codon:yes stop_codon:yes gene_type:complete
MAKYEQNDQVVIHNGQLSAKGIVKGVTSEDGPFGPTYIVQVTDGQIPNETYPYNTLTVCETHLTEQSDPDSYPDPNPILAEELIIPLINGGTLRCGKGTASQWGDYVRLCDEDGIEIVYWSYREWEDEGESVMGAIFSSALSPIEITKSQLNRTVIVDGDHWE